MITIEPSVSVVQSTWYSPPSSTQASGPPSGHAETASRSAVSVTIAWSTPDSATASVWAHSHPELGLPERRLTGVQGDDERDHHDGHEQHRDDDRVAVVVAAQPPQDRAHQSEFLR